MPRRFAELRDLLTGVSEKVLTAQLRQLEKRRRHSAKNQIIHPGQVTYYLSKADDELIPMMTDMVTGAPPPRHPSQPDNDPQGCVPAHKSPSKKSIAA